MKKWLSIIVLALIPMVGVCDEASKRENVEKLMIAMNIDSTMDTVYTQIGQMFQGMGQQMGIKPSEQDIFDKNWAKVIAAMKEEMNWEKMKGPMIDIYVKHYTEKEISDMLAFYQSESGRSVIQKMPVVMTDTMLVSQSMLKNFLPKMQQLGKELKAELDARRASQQ